MMRSVGTGLLALAWLYPLLSFLNGALELFSPTVLFPNGPALLDSNRTLLLILTLGAFLLSEPKCKPRTWRPAKPEFWGGLFLLHITVSCMVGGNPVDSLFFGLTWLAAGCALLAAGHLLPSQLTFTERAFLVHIPLLLLSVGSIMPVALDAETLKVVGPFRLANIYSNWLLLCLPLVVVDLKPSLSRAKTGLVMVTLTTCLCSLYLTNSRTSWFLTMLELGLLLLVLQGVPRARVLGWLGALFLGLVAIFFFRTKLGGSASLSLALALLVSPPFLETLLFKSSRSEVLKLLLVLICAFGCVRGVIALDPSQALSTHASERMENLVKGDNSTLSRTDFWRAAFQISNAHPVFGTGPDTFSKHYPEYQTRFYFYSDSPHSTTLELTSETGWVGGGLFILFFLLYLKRSQHLIKTDLHRSTAMVGLLIGLAHAQVDVTYQYAELWTTLAIILAVVARPQKAPATEIDGNPNRLPLLLYLLLLPLLFYVAYYQRLFEYSRLLDDDHRVLKLDTLVAERLPGWSRPSLLALETGLYLYAAEPDDPNREELKEQMESLAAQALESAPANSASYHLAGEVALLSARLEEAGVLYNQALSKDPFNYPRTYLGLFQVAAAKGDTKLADQWARTALALYSLEKIEQAHGEHRRGLTNQLVPLFYQIADFLNPWYEGKQTEPLYRFLLSTGESPRALHGLGISLFSQGKVDEAYPYLEKAHRLNPSYPPPPAR